MRKLIFLIFLLGCIFAQTSNYITKLETTTGVVTTGTVELLPYGNLYPTGALALSHDRDGIWFRNGVPNGEYSLYYNGSLVTSYQRFWIGENELTLIADKFDSNQKLQPDGLDTVTVKEYHLTDDIVGDSKLKNEAANSFPKRNVFAYFENNGKMSWDESTNTLSWNQTLNFAMPKGRFYQVAAGSIAGIGNGEVIMLSSTTPSLTAVDEDIADPTPNQTGYLVNAGSFSSIPLDSTGLIVVGVRRANSFYLHFPELESSIGGSGASGQILIIGSSGEPQYYTPSGDLDLTDGVFTFDSSVARFQTRNIIPIPQSSAEFTFNSSTSTLSWDGTISFLMPGQRSYDVATGSLSGLSDGDVVLLSSTTPSFTAVNEDLAPPSGNLTGYFIDAGSASAIAYDAKGMIVVGFREGDKFYFLHPSLQNALTENIAYSDLNQDLKNIINASKFWLRGSNSYSVADLRTIQTIKDVRIRHLRGQASDLTRTYKLPVFTYNHATFGDQFTVKDQDNAEVAEYKSATLGVIVKDTTGGLTKVTIPEKNNSGVEVDIWVDYQLVDSLNDSGTMIIDNDTEIKFSHSCYLQDDEVTRDSIWTFNQRGTNAVVREYMEFRPDSTIWMVIGTGQSNSVGHCDTCTFVLSTTQPYNNLKVETSTGNFGISDLAVDSLVERVKPTISDGSGYLNAETPYSGMANTATKLAKADGLTDHIMIVSNNGEDGAPLKTIRKNGLSYEVAPFSPLDAESYANSLITVDTAKSYADGLVEHDFRVSAVALIHGETDSGSPSALMPYGANLYYKDQLEEFRKQYDTDIKAKTNQLNDVKLLVSQQSFGNDAAGDMIVRMAQLRAAVEYPDITLVAPTYWLDKSDGVHFSNEAARLLGEYFGKVYNEFVIKGENWLPLYPVEILRNSASIVITFNVPSGVLEFDGSGVTNKGFTFYEDAGSPASITSVELLGTNQVRITLDKVPTGTVRKIRYAYNTTGGELRDTDSTTGQSGTQLKNYCVAFEIDVK